MSATRLSSFSTKFSAAFAPLALTAVLGLAMGCSETNEDNGLVGTPSKKDVSGGDGTATDGGATGGDTQTTGGDTNQPPVGCKNDADCKTKITGLGPCEQAYCDANQCKKRTLASGSQCDDGKPCTTGDQCKNGTCAGQETKCNDNNPCTLDQCNNASGKCESTPTTATCDDKNPCTETDACKDGKCEGAPVTSDACGCKVDDDCKKADDGDACNGTLICKDTKCVAKPDSAVKCDISKDGPCERTVCDPKDGQCKTKPTGDNAACNDNDACTKEDKCKACKCAGSALVCDDKNPCTKDACDATKGCTTENTTDKCDDQDLCTINDVCKAGKCTGETNPTCGGCTGPTDCEKFEDGDLCNGTLVCKDSKCVVDTATVKDCSATKPGLCERVVCEPATGECGVKPELSGAQCDDGSACTENDHCTETKKCEGADKTCNDGNSCTKDTCDPAKGCVATNDNEAFCDDKNACTEGDHCTDGKCAGTATAGCGCKEDSECAAFEDKDKCNGTLVCKEGACVVNPATVIVCEGAGLNPCVPYECIPTTGTCVKKPLENGATCDDQNACTTGDFCSNGVCKGKQTPCDDKNLCTNDSCDPDKGCVTEFNANACDDGSKCTENDVCGDGFCKGTPTVDCHCTTKADCATLEDGDLCNGTLFCKQFKCVVDPKTVVTCDASGNTCAENMCDKATGKCAAQNATDGKSCDDANECTGKDACKAGKCEGSSVDCDDKNPCTDDKCDSAVGCTHAPNTGACDDGDKCTENDSCDEGLCKPGKTNVTLCPNACAPAFTLGCEDFDAWSTLNTGATSTIKNYPCNTTDVDGYTGAEYVYTFTAPYDGKLSVALAQDSIFMDVLVLSKANTGCDAANCKAWDYNTADVEMKAGETYYIVVDSISDFSGDYTITTQCTPSKETICNDGLDDDGDNQIDCQDSDCTGTEACKPAACKPEWTLKCGQSDFWATTKPNATNVIGSYQGCDNSWSYGAAPEYTYKFVAPADGKVTLTLSNETAATDLMVLSDKGNGCEPGNCIAYDWLEGELTFDAKKDQTYYFVLDGYNGAQGEWTIEVTCADSGTPATGEICDNGKDDDADNKVDCEDDGCFGKSALCEPACTPDTTVLAQMSCPDSSDFWHNDGPGSTNTVFAYGCAAFTYSGPEYVYTYVAEADGPVTVTIDDQDADTDLILLEDRGLGCNPASCLDWGTSSISFTAVKGKTYYIAVDGWQGAIADYTLSFLCGG